MWCGWAAEHFTHSPTATSVHVLGVCGGSLFRNSLGHFPTEPGEILSVCPSGQTGCCVKQERPISAGISQSAPAGLCGRAAYQQQQKWFLVAPLAPLAPLEPCLNSGSGERFHTWFRWGLEQEDSVSSRSLSTAPPQLWLMDCKISSPMCSACLVQLWEEFQLWNDFSEEVSIHELMSLRTNYWVNCINSPWSASSVLSFWASKQSRQEDFQRMLCLGKQWCRWLSGFPSHSLKRQKGPQWSFGVKIYSLLIKKEEKKKTFLGQIIDSRLPSNVRKCSPPSRGSRLKGYLILSSWFSVWNNCLKWLVLAWETVCLPGTWTSVINFNVLLWVFP